MSIFPAAIPDPSPNIPVHILCSIFGLIYCYVPQSLSSCYFVFLCRLLELRFLSCLQTFPGFSSFSLDPIPLASAAPIAKCLMLLPKSSHRKDKPASISDWSVIRSFTGLILAAMVSVRVRFRGYGLWFGLGLFCDALEYSQLGYRSVQLSCMQPGQLQTE